MYYIYVYMNIEFGNTFYQTFKIIISLSLSFHIHAAIPMHTLFLNVMMYISLF